MSHCDCRKLEQENERLKREERERRYELEAAQEARWERERRERMERDRQRQEEREAARPSNRLYRGDCESFEDAMNCLAAAARAEIVSDPQSDAERKCNAAMAAYEARAARCRLEYAAAIQAAEADLIRRWRAAGDATLEEIADCLESGDYSPLAI
jgi:hypothetical protein